MKFKVVFMSSCLCITYGCIKPKNKIKEETSVITPAEKILITNEGGFGKGNAEVSYINPNTNEINNDLFAKANNNSVLGDVFQSIAFKSNLAYCILNNSGTIKIIDTEDFKLKGAISNLNQPRYISIINDNTAIVSALSLNKANVYNPITIINPTTFAKTGSVSMYGWTESILSLNKYSFICNYYKGLLFKLNHANLQLTDSLHLSYGCTEVIAYKNNQLLVLCSGDYSIANSSAKLYVVDTALIVLKTISLPTSSYSNIQYISSEDQVVILGENKIQSVDMINNTIVSIINANNNETFYGFGFDEKYKKYYICDAKDYQQKGKIIVCDKTGSRLTAYDAGYVPSKIYFNYK
jgi:hypothetical protein